MEIAEEIEMKSLRSRVVRIVSLLTAVIVFFGFVITEKPTAKSGDIDETRYLYTLVETSLGDFILELDKEKAPITCANFADYAESGFYDSTTFHRVIGDFMIQGGGFTVDMNRKQTREPIQNEWQNGLKNKRGTIAMARLGGKPHSATSQFFINVKDNDMLDRPQDGAGYAVFGRVFKGMDVVDRIRKVRTGTFQVYRDVPREPVIIKRVTVLVGKDLDDLKDKINGERKATVTPLHKAAGAGDLVKVRKLIEEGAAVNARDTLLETPLHYAARFGWTEIVEALVQAGADVKAVSSEGQTPLHLAAAGGFADIAELLVKKGAEVDAANRNHETPLALAAAGGHDIVVSLLLRNGANPNLSDSTLGRSPLLDAVNRDFEAIATELIEFSADVNRPDGTGQTPLHLAVRKGNEAMIELLIDAGSDVNIRNNNGDTPLHIATLAGNLVASERILEAGGLVNVANVNGSTPLHYAAAKDYPALARLFLDRGADINAHDNDGNTPLAIALKYRRDEVADLLRLNGGGE